MTTWHVLWHVVLSPLYVLLEHASCIWFLQPRQGAKALLKLMWKVYVVCWNLHATQIDIETNWNHSLAWGAKVRRKHPILYESTTAATTATATTAGTTKTHTLFIMNPKESWNENSFSPSILFSSSLVAKHPPFRQVTKNKAQSQSRSFLVDPKKLENHYISWRGTLVVYVPFWRAGSRICRKPSKMRNLMSLELWSTSWRTKLLPKIVWIFKKGDWAWDGWLDVLLWDGCSMQFS